VINFIPSISFLFTHHREETHGKNNVMDKQVSYKTK
jgi:hypothetical protein